MNLIGWLTGGILQTVLGSIMKPLEDCFTQYINKQITQAQLQEKVQEALLAGFATVEGQFQDSLNKTYASFMDTVKQSKIMQWIWSIVVVTQLVVLLWHQVGIPAFVRITGSPYPSSGTTVEWAYALLALCLGAPALSARIGPAASWASNSLSNLVKR